MFSISLIGKTALEGEKKMIISSPNHYPLFRVYHMKTVI